MVVIVRGGPGTENQIVDRDLRRPTTICCLMLLLVITKRRVLENLTNCNEADEFMNMNSEGECTRTSKA